jgi:transcriptional regulator with XRE-family HTH domain
MAYKILFFFTEEVINLKEIGEELKQAREKMGVTIDEAADDLKLKPSLLESIENGNKEPFKDVFTLKQIIKDK